MRSSERFVWLTGNCRLTKWHILLGEMRTAVLWRQISAKIQVHWFATLKFAFATFKFIFAIQVHIRNIIVRILNIEVHIRNIKVHIRNIKVHYRNIKVWQFAFAILKFAIITTCNYYDLQNEVLFVSTTFRLSLCLFKLPYTCYANSLV